LGARFVSSMPPSGKLAGAQVVIVSGTLFMDAQCSGCQWENKCHMHAMQRHAHVGCSINISCMYRRLFLAMGVMWRGVGVMVLICRHSVSSGKQYGYIVCAVVCMCCDIHCIVELFLVCLGSPERMCGMLEPTERRKVQIREQYEK
jgi:predicted nucleic acid-binding Zn ribbon protein